jgi:hypothetical protein
MPRSMNFTHTISNNSDPTQPSPCSDSLRAGRSGNRIPVGGEIFRACPDQPWSPPSLLHNGYRVTPGGKVAGPWSWPPIQSSAKVKERVELCPLLPLSKFKAGYVVEFTITRTQFTET